MTKEFFYISNLISISRFFLTAVCAYFLLTWKYDFAVIMIIVIWVSDLLDGFIARIRNEITELGKIIDPLADKTAISIISLILVFQGVIPLWFFIVIVLRDLLILSGGLFLKSKIGKVPQSNLIGKITVFIIGLTILIFLLKKIRYIAFLAYHNEFTELLLSLMILLSLVLIVFSIISYLNRFLKLIKPSTN